jgi:N-methylhydantoinase A/oxoprolinase/acetone carboxylase beta subunit
MKLRLGIDVGGTNTDAVVLDQHATLLARFKSPTTPDVSSGIRNALHGLLATHPGLDLAAIRYAMLGTTHCTNAIVERRNLNRVGLVRIGAPASLAIKPFVEWPKDLLTAIDGRSMVVEGGYEYDGRETRPLDVAAVRAAAESFAGYVDSVAVSGVFSPVDPSQERQAGEILRDVLGDDMPISYSHEIGSLGLLERENAAVLNAALVRAAFVAAGGFRQALIDHGIDAQLFFSQNDGTLMALDYAVRYPILTVASGPTNSIRGAAFLSGLKDAVVVDVGGTSTDVGILVNGIPRESSIEVDIGGVRTNFRMPDVLSIALGGGTRIVIGDALRIGPESVGHRLTVDARIFGGEVLTLSDVAVAAGRAQIGDPTRVADLDRALVDTIMQRVRALCEDAIDQVKTSSAPMPIILVGGGSVIIPSPLAGAFAIVRPTNYDVANAIGAAIAQCSGEIERIFALHDMTRAEALALAQQLARDEAIKAGADSRTVAIIDVQEVPLAYLPGSATRIRVRAAGDLALE